MAIRCRQCRGEYEVTLSDGAQYFHACPPFHVEQWDPPVGPNIFFSLTAPVGGVTLRIPGVGNTLVLPVAPPALSVLVAEYSINRPRQRNENVRRNPTTGATEIIAEGDGIEPV
jgi:hypothetical protein